MTMATDSHDANAAVVKHYLHLLHDRITAAIEKIDGSFHRLLPAARVVPEGPERLDRLRKLSNAKLAELKRRQPISLTVMAFQGFTVESFYHSGISLDKYPAGSARCWGEAPFRVRHTRV